MSLGPTATSVMQAYGLPCAFSTEQEVRSKTARRAAPVAVEVNSEGVLQLEGLSTRGMFMSGGPQTYERNVTLVDAATTAVTLTPAQLVDGILIIANGDGGAVTVTLPNVLAVNAFLNSNLVSGAAALAVNVGSNAPRTVFKLTVITNIAVGFIVNATQPAGHAVGASGFSTLNVAATGADLTITSLALPPVTRTGIITAVASTPRVAVDVYFIQTAGTGTDPEWLIVSN